MANADIRYGFKPWGPLCRTKTYRVRGSDNAPICVGDPVGVTTSDGPYVTAATADITGVVGASLAFLTGGVTGSVLVANDPTQLFEVQHDGTSALTNIGETASHVYVIGNLVTRLSNAELDTSEINVGADTWKIVDEVAAPDNATGANARAIVSPTSEHDLFTATGY